MSQEPLGKITVITRPDFAESRSGDRTHLVSTILDIMVLRDQFRAFMQNLQAIIDVGGETDQPFHLTEIQFNAEITGSGEVKLLGTGVGVEASSSITFVLQRRNGIGEHKE